MRIAIVHYHLGGGGVGHVIRLASRALEEIGTSHVVLAGNPPDGDGWAIEAFPARILPGLGYRREAGDLTTVKLLEQMREAAASTLGGPPDVWHFHNHSLGKNSLVPGVVSLLAAAGERMVLHIHDLAEDGRPANARMISGLRDLYPFSDRIRYVFVNPRDRGTFIDAGLPEENTVLLPNPIQCESIPAPAGNPDAGRLLFAPVRGIRRKNLGELVLLAALSPKDVKIATSRFPANPEALPVHENWRRFAAGHRLRIDFGVVDRIAPAPGRGKDFGSWLSSASHIVSTSVAEGFGLPFLEAVAWGKPLLGRGIPCLAGLHGGHGDFYDSIAVPLDWVEETVLRSHIEVALRRNFRLLGRQLDPAYIDHVFEAMVRDRTVDFGNLPEALQQEIIERVGDPHQRILPLVHRGEIVKPLVEWLSETLASSAAAEVPPLSPAYAPETHAENLMGIYQELAASPGDTLDHVPPARILDAHLSPGAFHFLCSALPPVSRKSRFKAVVFDVYGTLMVAAAGGVKPDPKADALIGRTIEHFGHEAPPSPSTELHSAVLRHHAESGERFPEVDLRVLWREVLSIPEGMDVSAMVTAIEDAWHPATAMKDSVAMVSRLSREGVSLGLLSNAQCNTLHSLGDIADLFAPELRVLSYQHGIAKPDERLFRMMADRLEGRGISPYETLYIGNEPAHDIAPASVVGFKTALFGGTPADEGAPVADHFLSEWSELECVVWPRPGDGH